MPGIPMEALEILIEGKALTLRGVWVPERPDSNQETATCLIHERARGGFSRSILLPCEPESEKARATLKNGVLALFLPKADRAKAHKIQIRPPEE